MKAKIWYYLIIAFSLLALFADGTLTYNKLTDSAVGCPAGGGCDIVKGSIYSEIFGIPVSLIGMGAFLSFIALALLGLKKKLSNEKAFLYILVLSGLGLIPAAYFMYIMFVVLEAICPWCVFSHAMLLGVVISSYIGWKGSV